MEELGIDTQLSLELSACNALGETARVSKWEVLNMLRDQLCCERDLLLGGDHAPIVCGNGCGHACMWGMLQSWAHCMMKRLVTIRARGIIDEKRYQ